MSERLGTQLQSGGLEQSIHTGLLGKGMFAGASLDLNFAATKNIGPLVTFTRASSATYVGSDGLIKTAATNEPRFNHNPTTGESLGLLVEEQRTNLVTSSATFQPSSGGSPASYTVDQVAPDGTTTASRQTAANPRTFVDYTGIANAQYTFSVYAKATSGTITISLQLKNAATDTVITAGSNVTLTTAWQRLTVTGTTNGATTGARIEVIGPVVGAPAGAVFWGAQLEAGSFPTSYIPTTTAAATRSADVASITGTAFSSWYRQDEGTVFAESRVQEFTVTNFSRIASLDRGDATTNFAAIVRSSALNRVEYSVFVGTGQAVGLQPAITFAAGSTLRSAFVYKTDDFIAAANGILSPADTLGTVTTAVTTLGVGMQGNGGLPYNGTIRRLTYWPQRLANSTLQAITL